MPGMQFEFDETGGSFYYFLVSFYFLSLSLLTYFFWPRSDNQDSQDQFKRKCRCDHCQNKSHFLSKTQPNKQRRRKIKQTIFFIAWVMFFLIGYKVSQIEMEWNEFDPFSELGVSKDATSAEIRKAYKMLSLKFHPDKGGDSKRFIRLSKAYAALTNEQSRKNWVEHGNPDGPGATQFGIALPKWIVEKKNSVWVLGAYVFVFMILLPVIVGIWWYRTIKFNSDKILLNTSQLYFYFFNRTPNMPLKRAIMILSSSFEFNKAHNSEIVERPSDNMELPTLLKHFPQINIKIREMPFAAPYSIKSRILIYSHLHRFPLPMHTLNKDKNVIIKKCPYLINEMINTIAQLVAFGHHDSGINVPRLDTMEYCMKLSQIIVQGLSESQNPLLQLPHITEDMLRYFVTKKRNVRSIRQFVELKEEDRRNILRSLSEDQYRDILTVSFNMPLIIMECKCEVRDEDDSSITPCSIVTVTVRLSRRPLGSLCPDGGMQFLTNIVCAKNQNNISFTSPTPTIYNVPIQEQQSYSGLVHHNTPSKSAIIAPSNTGDYSDENINEGDKLTIHTDGGAVSGMVLDDGDIDTVTSRYNVAGELEQEKSPPKKKPVWEKNRGKKKNNKGKSKNKAKATANSKQQNGKLIAAITKNPDQEDEGRILEDQSDTEDIRDGTEGNQISTGKQTNIDKDDNSDDSSVNNAPVVSNTALKSNSTSDKSNVYNDEEDVTWQRFQEEARRENSLETRARCTHLVHCPLFLADKYEWWWVYLCDRKGHQLITAPLQVCSLQDDEELQLKFTAPNKPGQYFYTVALRSDSYIDFDLNEQIKITVKEEKKRDYDAQWKISDEEDNSCQSDEDDDDDEVDDDSDDEASDMNKEGGINDKTGGDTSLKNRHTKPALNNKKKNNKIKDNAALNNVHNDSDFSSNTDYDYDD